MLVIYNLGFPNLNRKCEQQETELKEVTASLKEATDANLTLKDAKLSLEQELSQAFVSCDRNVNRNSEVEIYTNKHVVCSLTPCLFLNIVI